MPAGQTGARGEALTAAHYSADGFEVLCANYRCRQGEIDLVLRKDSLYVFAEVKTRSSAAFAQPREWVTPAKQRRVILAAGAYLQANALSEVPTRFDVVEVLLEKDGSCHITRIEDAFSL